MLMRPLEERNFDTVHRIFKQVFDRTKWEEDFHESWDKRDKPNSIGAYTEDDTLLAYAIVTTKPNLNGIFLEFLAVNPEFQGGGVGTILLLTLLQRHPTIQLVPVNNDKLIHWYKKHGFHIIAEKKDRWGDPELLMSTCKQVLL